MAEQTVTDQFKTNHYQHCDNGIKLEYQLVCTCIYSTVVMDRQIKNSLWNDIDWYQRIHCGKSKTIIAG